MSPVTRGTISIPETQPGVPATPMEDLDRAVADLAEQAVAWSTEPVSELIELVEGCIDATIATAPEWVAAGTRAKRLREGTFETAENWIYSIFMTGRYLRLLSRSLRGIAQTGRPPIPGKIRTGPGGRLVVPALPVDGYDRILMLQMSAEVWMQPGVGEVELYKNQARAYQGDVSPGVSLVLGAGNIDAIPVMDALGRLFVTRHPVVLKMNPVNDYAGPCIERALAPLVRRGVLRVVYGGAEAGAHLVHHPEVADVHITGSDKSFEAIVFGAGPQGQQRKARSEPILDKPVTAELGNLSPTIVVPGPWSARDLAYQGQNIAWMLTTNAGFNCATMRVLVTHRQWGQRDALLDAVRSALRDTPQRYPYYPGAEDRWRQFVEAHPEAERFGREGPGLVPWTLIPGIDPARGKDEICLNTEAFNGVFCETTLDAHSPADYVRRAVEFVNEEIWGSLGAVLLVHPKSLRDPDLARAVDDAIARLRYGTVAINLFSGFNFALGTTTWGAYPGHPLNDIQTGVGVVHNALMLEGVEKSVFRSAFRLPLPRAPWFPGFRHAESFWRGWALLEARRSLRALPGVLFDLLRG